MKYLSNWYPTAANHIYLSVGTSPIYYILRFNYYENALHYHKKCQYIIMMSMLFIFI